MSDILDKINKENVEKFGPLCEECDSFERYCRCESAKAYIESLKQDERIPKLNIEPIPEADVGEYIKRITAYFKKPVEHIEDEQIN